MEVVILVDCSRIGEPNSRIETMAAIDGRPLF